MSAWRWKSEGRVLAAMVAVFALAFWLPVGRARFDASVLEALYLVRWYAREHVLLCLIPAFFIAGAIGIFLNQDSVMRYLGPRANKALAYGVASVSGTILAVCSCTVLPLFAGIYCMGAGLGPASAFLYAGPAINVLAIVLTARVLGLEIGIARALGAVLLSVVIGLAMHLIFRREESARAADEASRTHSAPARPLIRTILYFAAMVAVLIFANWGRPDSAAGLWHSIHAAKWILTAAAAAALGVMLAAWFGLGWRRLAAVALPVAALSLLAPWRPLLPFAAAVVLLSALMVGRGGELGDWFEASWDFAKQILPLLLAGILVAGFLLGRPEHDGLIPSAWVAQAVGGNGLGANLFAAVAGAFMYFATLTEVPILQGLIGAGMGKGPALALLLAGPALSLPSMLVLVTIMGMRKTVVFCSLVVAMATISGLLYGAL
jgi:hypothetical protein